MVVRITENELKKLISESVQRLLEFDEGFGYGFDETVRKRPAPPKMDPADKDGNGITDDNDMEKKRNFVISKFSNKEDGTSDVKRIGAIQLLYHPKDKKEWDTYRSEFSKYLNPEDTAHVWDDSQINILYNWLNDIL